LHLEQFRRVLQRVLELATVSDAVRLAEEKEAEAQSALDQISERETEALGKWSVDPTQPPPSFVEERQKAAAVLVPLRAEATEARRRMELLTPKMLQAQ